MKFMSPAAFPTEKALVLVEPASMPTPAIPALEPFTNSATYPVSFFVTDRGYDGVGVPIPTLPPE